MNQFIETIKCKNGKLYNLEYHQARFYFVRKKYFPNSAAIQLAETIQVPKEFQQGLFRCRVLYASTTEKIEFLPHQIRPINSLKLIEDNTIDYSCKFSNRERLKELFEQRGNCDDILIVKNKLIGDSFTANPIFYDGKRWWTPNSPLLAGTQRARLISEGKIKPCKIQVEDLKKYQKVGLINALQDMNDMPIIEIKHIV